MGLNKNVKLISGMHRSGTTFVGEVLASVNRYQTLHEPFNKEYGVIDVPAVYVTEELPGFDIYMQEIINLNFKTVRTNPEDNLKEKVFRKLQLGKTGRDKLKIKFFKLLNRSDGFFIKDPFLLLSAPYLAEEYNIASVIIIRHPMAIWNSIKRMGWQCSFTGFATKEIIEKYTGYNDLNYLNSLSEIEKFAYQYNILYSTVYKSHADKVLLIKHEDICIAPLENFSFILNHFDLKINEKMEKIIIQNTNGDLVGYDNKKLHNFSRNSKSLAWAWCLSQKDKDEMVIKRICGGLVENYYGFWRPQ